MPADGHRPIRNTDPTPAEETSLEVLEAAPSRPAEAVVLPYYQPPRRRRESPKEELFEAFADAEIQPSPARDAGEGSFGETMLLEVVIGNDDRVRVADQLLQTNPWRQICALRIRANTGTSYVGTAWFIGPQLLGTA